MTPNRLHSECHLSPIGLLQVITTDEAVLEVRFPSEEGTPSVSPASPAPDVSHPTVMHRCLQQLDEYFRGQRRAFDLPLHLVGTPFQRRAWEQLLRIPYGHTASYGEQAHGMGNPKAVRAVGMANNKNKIPIIIPCHRVIGKNGTLVGYGGGIQRKQWLLEHEKKILNRETEPEKGV